MEFWVEIIEFECFRSCVYIPYCISLKSQGINDVNLDRILGFQALYCSSAWKHCRPENEFLGTVASRVGAYRFKFFEVGVLILIESWCYHRKSRPRFRVLDIQFDWCPNLVFFSVFRIFAYVFVFWLVCVVGGEPSSKGKALEGA